MRFFLVGVRVLALPDVPGQVTQHAREVMVAASAGRGCFTKLAAADDSTESLALGLLNKRGAAPKRGAVIRRQTT